MSTLQAALDAYKNGDLIIVTDDADRENEGDLMLRADMATTEKVAFMVRHTTGILCVAMTQDRARQLHLPLMVEENQDSKKTAFTVSVDYKVGITTGVSAEERANTVRALANTSGALRFHSSRTCVSVDCRQWWAAGTWRAYRSWCGFVTASWRTAFVFVI